MYDKYNVPKDKCLLYRKNFLQRQKNKMLIRNFNKQNAGKITGNFIGDEQHEIDTIDRLLLWVNCELKNELNCDEHLECSVLPDIYFLNKS